MNRFLKLFFLGFLLGAMGTSLNASDCNGQSQCPTGCPKPVCKKKPKYEEPKCNEKKYCPAYSAPADIEVKCGWDVEIDASFLYWYVGQDYMDAGFSVSTSGSTTTRTVAIQNFEYKPGFKVGIGVDLGHDDWVFNTEYTWIRNRTDTSYRLPSNATWRDNDWFIDSFTNGTTLSSQWTMDMDVLDGLLSRPFWEGKQLTVTPHVALRALWLRQSFTIDMASSSSLAQSNNKSKEWALGPNLGLNGNWLLGKGFRLEGNGALSLLYTRYTKVSHQENIGGTIQQGSIGGQSALRPIAEAGLGFGWGSYFRCCRYHIDFVARYDYMLLWSQNKMREWVGMLNGWVDDIGDLYLHGFTFQARFDF